MILLQVLLGWFLSGLGCVVFSRLVAFGGALGISIGGLVGAFIGVWMTVKAAANQSWIQREGEALALWGGVIGILIAALIANLVLIDPTMTPYLMFLAGIGLAVGGRLRMQKA